MDLPIRKKTMLQIREQAAALAEKRIRFSHPQDTRHLEYGIYRNGTLIGFINGCGIHGSTIEIGYAIHPDYQGQGYATEAVCALLQELRDMGLRSVTAGFFTENQASRRVMEKCAMTLTDYWDKVDYRGSIHTCRYCEIRL